MPDGPLDERGRPTQPRPPAGLVDGIDLCVTVWVDEQAAWQAVVTWSADGQGHRRAFDSPFELARFVTQVTRLSRMSRLKAAAGGVRAAVDDACGAGGPGLR